METKTLLKKRTLFGADVDMLGGKLPSSIIIYVIPLVLTSMLQVLYNAADVIVVSHFAGDNAMAAVGATASIIGLVVNALISMSTGVNILLSRFIGAGDKDKTRSTVSTSFYFSLILGVAVAVLAELVAYPMLRLTDCPENIIDKSATYLRIYFIGVPATMFYNFMSSVLRIKGDSRRPFIYLAISGLVNVALNLVLVIFTPLDVEGVAIATVVSQYLSAIFLFIRLLKLDDDCRLRPREIKDFNFGLMGKIIRYGFPAAVSSATFSVANLQIQSAINAFGDAAIAGNTAAGNIEALFLFSVVNPIGLATATFIGQNIGAGNKERVSKLIKHCYALAAIVTVALGAMTCLLANPLLAIYISEGNTAAVDFGIVGLYVRMGTGVLFAMVSITNGILQAYGYTTYQMINSLIFTVGIRVFWMSLIYPLSKSAFMIYICYPISWTCVFIGGAVMTVSIVRKYKRGVEFNL